MNGRSFWEKQPKYLTDTRTVDERAWAEGKTRNNTGNIVPGFPNEADYQKDDVIPQRTIYGPDLPPGFQQREPTPTTAELHELEARGELFDPSGSGRLLYPPTPEFLQERARNNTIETLAGAYPAAQETLAGLAVSGAQLYFGGFSDPLFKSDVVFERAKELRKEGAGPLEAAREGWRQTDMPTARVHLAWSFDWDTMGFTRREVPLWGDKTFGGVDIGAKGFFEEIVVDPLNIFGIGKGVKWGTKSLVKGGGSIVEGQFRPTVSVPTGKTPPQYSGKTIPVGGGSPDWAGSVFVAGPTDDVFGIGSIKVNLTQKERVMKWLANHTRVPIVVADDLAVTAKDKWVQIRNTADNLATSMASEFGRKANMVFTVDKNGTIPSLKGIDPTLKGAPTIQDVAARLPRFYEHLTAEQRSFLNDLRSRLGTIDKQMSDLGIDIDVRDDLMTEGLTPSSSGFYLPRGNAFDEGVDAPRPITTKFLQKGKPGFQKQEVFPSMAEGIWNGYEYISFTGAIRTYVKSSGITTADKWMQNVVLAARGADGELLAQTAVDRLKKSDVYWENKKLRNRIRNKKRTIIERNIHLQAQGSEAERAWKRAEKLAEGEDPKVGRIRAESTEGLRPGMSRIERAEARLEDAAFYNHSDLVAAKNLVSQSITAGRRIMMDVQKNLDDLKEAGKTFRGSEKVIQKHQSQLDEIVAEAEKLKETFDDDIVKFVETWEGAVLPGDMGRKYYRLLKEADKIDDKIDVLETAHIKLKKRINDMRDRDQFLRDEDKATTAARREFQKEIDDSYEIEIMNTRLKTELVMLEKEQARSMKLLEKIEARDIKRLQKEVSDATADAINLDERTAKTLLSVHEAQDDLALMKQNVSNIQSKLAKEIRATSRIPGDRSVIDLPGLRGYSFPTEMANVINKQILKEMPLQSKTKIPIFNQMLSYFDFYRSIRATGDDSAVGIHGLLMAFDNPKATAETFLQHWKAWGTDGENLLGRAIVDFNDRAIREGRLTSEDWARHGVRIGGEETEFYLRGAGGRIQKLPIIKQANRAFGFYGDKSRLEWADDLLQEQLRNGKTLTELEQSGKLREIAEGVNTATGWNGSDFGDIGRLLLFAPRFLGARLNNLQRTIQATVTDPVGTVEALPGVGRAARRALEGKGVRDIPLQNRIARRSMLRFIGGAAMLTYGVNWALGNESDFRVLVKEEDKDRPGVLGTRWVYNPQFGRIRFRGSEYSFFGTYDSLIRAIIMSGTGWKGGIDSWRSMGSAGVVHMFDQITGEDVMGKSVDADWIPDWMPGNSTALARIGGLLQEHVPFSLEDLPDAISRAGEGDYASGAVKAGSQFFGIPKETPLGYNDLVDVIAREEGLNPEELSRGDKRKIHSEPRMVEYLDALDIEEVGVDLSFENLRQALHAAEQDLVAMIEAGADLERLSVGIAKVKKQRWSTYDTWERMENNKEAVEDMEEWKPNHISDHYGHKYWTIELEENLATGWQNWDKFEADRAAVLREAHEVGGDKMINYILNPSGPNEHNYRSIRFQDERVRALVEEYETDQEIMREYFNFPRELTEAALAYATEAGIDNEIMRYQGWLDLGKLSRTERNQFLDLAKWDPAEFPKDPAKQAEIEKAREVKKAISDLDKYKIAFRADPENWYIEAKLWKWGKLTAPQNPIVKNMKRLMMERSDAEGNLGYYQLADIEELIQSVRAAIEQNTDPDKQLEEIVDEHLLQLSQQLGVGGD